MEEVERRRFAAVDVVDELLEPRRRGAADSLVEVEARVRLGPGPMTARGLLDKRPGWYALTIGMTVALFAAGIAWLILVDSLWLQIPNALFLAFVMVQFGLIGHDAGHRQMFREGWKHRLVGIVTPTDVTRALEHLSLIRSGERR